MSERLSFSSTKYGPSVLDGVRTHDVVAACATSDTPSDSSSRSGPETLLSSTAAPAAPAMPTAWRRVRLFVDWWLIGSALLVMSVSRRCAAPR